MNPKQKTILNYLHINSRHRKDLQRWVLLGCEPEKFPLAFVPFHRVECVSFKVVLADQIYIFASLHSCRHEHFHVLQRHDKVWKMEKVFHFSLERDVNCGIRLKQHKLDYARSRNHKMLQNFLVPAVDSIKKLFCSNFLTRKHCGF